MKRLTQEEILELLPSGSGIDCEWHTSETRTYWQFHNSYHCMNEWGFYDGYADFTLRVPKESEDMSADFKLEFNGANSQYRQRKYLLREYLEDLFADVLRSRTEEAASPSVATQLN